uniref:Major facilitator superfamily (MFS) profile domain-containing protein n=1 Tax=Vombatus ursinus TaxID=29139 RepID=A0A4X2K894_VOMUR
MAFEDLLPEVGDKGRFQILQVFFFAIPMILIGSHFLLENFTAFVPEHRCWVHFLDNTSALLNVSGNLNFSSLLKFSIPLDSNGNPEKCRRFFWPQWQSLGPNVTGQNVSQLEMEPCVDGWVYDQSIFTSSIVTEWDLVCDSQTLKSFSQSIFLAGNLVGYLIWGYLSDRFGRKGMLLPNFLMLAVSSTGTAFVQSFPVYCCFRFLFGSSVTGIMVGSGTLSKSSFMGHLFLGFVAYGIQEWRKFQLVMSAPFFAFFLASWWLPESARWLIVQNRYDEALKVLTKVAKINGVKETTLTIEALRSTMEMELVPAQTRYTMLDLVYFPILRTRMLCLSFVGFTTGMLFYGFFLDLQNLGSNIQTLQVLFGTSTFLSRFVALFIMTRLGRRTITASCLLLAGLFISASAFLPRGKRVGILRVVLAMLAINCIVVSISSNSVYSAELTPTVVRGRCLGLILMVNRIGAILAPLVNMLKHYLPALPLIIFAAMAITAGLVVFFFLLETQNKPMPDTIEDIECG